MRFDLDAIDAPTGEGGAPRSIALRDIDEDPEQPRSEFDDASLRELAATIGERGVKQPVSVRPHPSQAGRWMLNFGARRLRAAKLAGLEQIPVFIDEAADSYDQVIENEQRESLTPLELALFVQRRLQAGETQAEIARRIGKSKMYVTYATALIDAPDWLLELYRSGRCRGLRELHELRRLHAENSAAVQTWVAAGEGITRQAIEELRRSLTVERSPQVVEPNAQCKQGEPAARHASAQPRAVLVTRRELGLPESSPQRALCADLDGAVVTILAQARPPEIGQVYVLPVGGRDRVCVDAARLRLLGFIDVATA
jgi:ParB family chromosome partitioning protein